MMNQQLEVQKYLRNVNNSLDTLNQELGIKYKKHISDPIVILDYCQLASPRSNSIVRECRGLVLELDSWNVIAKPMDRFFNWGEFEEEGKEFNWSKCFSESKEDGTLIISYYYGNTWRFNTRFTYGDVECNGKTWLQLVRLAIVNQGIRINKLDSNLTYCFELVGPYNKNVRTYNKTELYLLNVTNNKSLTQYESEQLDLIAEELKVNRPIKYELNSIKKIEKFINVLEKEDPTNEGVVIRDNSFNRWKIKSRQYIALHALKDNGNVANPKYLIPMILNGESDELLTYFPELKDDIDKYKSTLDTEYEELKQRWISSCNIIGRKEFASSIKDYKICSILFQMRDEFGIILDQEELNHSFIRLRNIWSKSERSIIKIIFKGNT